jgi:hypothetical protein
MQIRFYFIYMSGHEYCKHHIAYDWLILLFLHPITTLLGRNI